MFYFLSKAIDFLAMPTSIILMLLLYGYVVRSEKTRKRVVGIIFILLLLFSNLPLVMWSFNQWEPQAVNLSDIKEQYDVGILLSGGLINPQQRDEDHASLGRSGDRVLQTYLLYHAGKIKKILVTGTSADGLIALKKGETRRAAELLVSWGVPARDIIFEEKARNTRENAVFSARILKQKFPSGKYILITSAFHMRRSAGCFEKAGIQTTIFPADFYGGYNSMSFKDAVIPDPDAIAYFSVLWHEWIGYVVYKMVGYC
jgi:uncharacterized SAM-binding protein YcdF (DUF218 family)